jgi:threonine/homoserine/homoserine lactone efflux protein
MWLIFSVLGIFSLGVISPGPDFSVVVKNSLTQGRKEGLLTALGIATGMTVHITYSILGMGLLIGADSPLIRWIKILGATYLIYLGIRSILSSASKKTEKHTHKPKSKRSWYYEGLLTNLLNPHAALFLISIISSIIGENPLFIVALTGFCIALTGALWFTIVSVVFSFKTISKRFLEHTNLINRMLGLVLIAFGLRLLIL